MHPQDEHDARYPYRAEEPSRADRVVRVVLLVCGVLIAARFVGYLIGRLM